MDKINNALRQKAINGQIKLQDALQIADHADKLFEDAAELLNKVKPHIGMYIGGEIDMILSRITNRRSREQVYHKDREPDGQA